MELQLKPAEKNTYPIGGFFIRGNAVHYWLAELQRLDLSLEQVAVHPIPDLEPNSVWGCLVITAAPIKGDLKHEACQRVFEHCFIPEKTIFVPKPSPKDAEIHFKENTHVFHPEFGLYESTHALNWGEVLAAFNEKSVYAFEPVLGTFIPEEIKQFQVQPVEEDVLDQLQGNVGEDEGKLDEKPLSPTEKGKLSLYQKLFKKAPGKAGEEGEMVPGGLLSGIGKIVDGFSKNDAPWVERIQQSFEDLERRNKERIDRLMDLFNENPEEALKYAIPLDQQGSSRGANDGLIDLSKRWGDFSLFGGRIGASGSGSGGAVNIGNHFDRLTDQYNKTAQDLLNKKEYEKAAFVYLKLLKNYYKAAQVLEEGKRYEQAAQIYLKHMQNKQKAAECYEKGNMFEPAIELYKELNQYEKVGDLYLHQNNESEAFVYYQKRGDELTGRSQYLEAAKLYRLKMQNHDKAQETLLEGWQKGNDAFSCLDNYFSAVNTNKELKREIDWVYAEKTEKNKRKVFLRVIAEIFDRNEKLAAHVKELGYAIVAEEAAGDAGIVDQLHRFNKEDRELNKDTGRYKLSRSIKRKRK